MKAVTEPQPWQQQCLTFFFLLSLSSSSSVNLRKSVTGLLSLPLSAPSSPIKVPMLRYSMHELEQAAAYKHYP
jgi:hypothetical protein